MYLYAFVCAQNVFEKYIEKTYNIGCLYRRKLGAGVHGKIGDLYLLKFEKHKFNIYSNVNKITVKQMQNIMKPQKGGCGDSTLPREGIYKRKNIRMTSKTIFKASDSYFLL